MPPDPVEHAVATFLGDDPGRAVLVADPDDGRILAVGGDTLRPPAASLAKVPLVAAVLMAAAEEQLDLSTRVDPGRLARTRYPSIHGAVTTPLTLRELAALAIVVSDNAAAQVVGDHLDDAAWRDALQQLGLPAMSRPSGFTDDHLDAAAQVRTSLEEQAAILRVVTSDERLAPLLDWMGDNLRNGRVSRMIPPPTRFHHKTGTLDGVLHDVGLLVGTERRLIVVVLTEGQQDPVATEVAMATLGVALTAVVSA